VVVIILTRRSVVCSLLNSAIAVPRDMHSMRRAEEPMHPSRTEACKSALTVAPRRHAPTGGAKSTPATAKKSKGFTDKERIAMRQRA
jgi:hypothetical protein